DILVDRVARVVAVDRGRDGELVDVVDRDRKGLRRGRAVGRGRRDDDDRARTRRNFSHRTRSYADPSGGADREQAQAGAAGDGVAVAVGGGVGLRLHPFPPRRSSDLDILVDRVARVVAVDRGRDGELVDVVDRDRKGLRRGRAVGRGRRDDDGAARTQRLAVDRRRGGDHPAGGVDREQAQAGAAGDGVADAVDGGSGVRGERGHPDRRADRDILVDRVARVVAVDRGRDGELVDVVDRDRKGLRRGRAVGRGRRDDDGAARTQRLAVDRRRGGDHPAGGVDREQAQAGAAGDGVADAVGGGVGVRGERGHPDRRADRDILVDRVARVVAVDRGRDGELVDVVARALHALFRSRAVGRGRRDDDGAARTQRLAVDRRRGGDHPAGGVDR